MLSVSEQASGQRFFFATHNYDGGYNAELPFTVAYPPQGMADDLAEWTFGKRVKKAHIAKSMFTLLSSLTVGWKTGSRMKITTRTPRQDGNLRSPTRDERTGSCRQGCGGCHG